MFIIFYAVILLTLTLYSYSQIDLNLTLSSNAIYQSFQKQLIYLGYFSRPLSTTIYLVILFLLLASYFLLLLLVIHRKLILSNIVWLIALSIIILFFSYPAFSHDIFNYMFDARIITKYGLSPYFYKALDFPSDTWTRFMHWTHRTYPYGPVWLLLTLPFSLLGFGKFVITLSFFKLMFIFFHLGNIFLISKILAKVAPGGRLLGIAFYSFNPLILIESLVSPHNEVVMLFFLLLAIYQGVVKTNYLLAGGSLIFSAGVKFITIIFLPLFILFKKERSNKKIKRFFKLILLFLIPPLIFQIIYREPYPWYFILLVGAGTLLAESKNIQFLIFGVTVGALLRYAPYLYQGEYTYEVKIIQHLLFLTPAVLGGSWIILRGIIFRKRQLWKQF